jgi:hypothetical protein
MTLKEKYADQPLDLRDKLIILDMWAYASNKITLYELHNVEFPLDKGTYTKRVSWWQRLLRRAK